MLAYSTLGTSDTTAAVSITVIASAKSLNFLTPHGIDGLSDLLDQIQGKRAAIGRLFHDCRCGGRCSFDDDGPGCLLPA